MVYIVPIDGEVQKFVPRSLKEFILYAHQYLRLPGHSAERSMNDTMQREVYWPHMANDVFTTVNDLRDCAPNTEKKTWMQHLAHFLASGPLEFIAIEILGPLPETTNGNQFVVVMTDRYSKMIRAAYQLERWARHMSHSSFMITRSHHRDTRLLANRKWLQNSWENSLKPFASF